MPLILEAEIEKKDYIEEVSFKIAETLIESTRRKNSIIKSRLRDKTNSYKVESTSNRHLMSDAIDFTNSNIKWRLIL